MTDSLPELLAPAGSLDAFLAAVAAGADAVYCGLGAFNARASATDIDPTVFGRAVRLAHAHGVRVYVTCNVYLREGELASALELARTACAAGADALIVADAGFVSLLRREIPGVEIHLSTQTGVMSAAGASFVARELGVERVTVSRELSVTEIADVVRAGLPVEVFCHGAICVCYSGACAFSALRRGRSANRGDCTQPCRMTYDLQDAQGTSLVPEDENRLLCPRDYCSIEHIDELVAAGVSALKIEGRMKNPDYVYNVVSTYRAALDAYAAGTYDAAFARACKQRLGMSFNRGFTDAYLRGASGAELMSFERACNQGMPVGMLVDRGRDEVVVALDVDVRAGDMFEIRSTPGPDAPKDVPKRWPQVPCPVDAPAGARITVHCKRKVEVGSAVHRISSVDVLERSRAAVVQMHAELEAFEETVGALAPGLSTLAGETEALGVAELAPAVVDAACGAEPTCAPAACATGEPLATASTGMTATLAYAASEAPAAAPIDTASAFICASGETAGGSVPLEPHLSVLVRDAGAAAALLDDARVGRVLVRESTVLESLDAWEELLGCLVLVLDEPACSRDEEAGRELAARSAGIVCRNYAQLDRAQARIEAERVPFDVATPLSVTNSSSAVWFAAGGAGCVWLPDELSCEEICSLARSVQSAGTARLGVFVYGRPQLMVCEHCLLTAEGPCAEECPTCRRRAAERVLVERDGSRLPVRVDTRGRTRIYSDTALDRTTELSELLAAGVSDCLIDAQLLDAGELDRVLAAFAAELGLGSSQH